MRLKRIAVGLLGALATRRRVSVRRMVEAAWHRLGGAATLSNRSQWADAENFLDLLDELQIAGDIADIRQLEQRLATLYAAPDPEADDSLQLMTIHKAKGLEFDVVILTGLGRRPRTDDKSLLLWLERPRSTGFPDMLLAPVKAATSERDPLYDMVLSLQQDKDRLEQARLLYVALTRARHRLYLVGHNVPAFRDDKWCFTPPDSRSLLAWLWPHVSSAFEASLDSWLEKQATAGKVDNEQLDYVRRIYRLPQNWCGAQVPQPVFWQSEDNVEITDSQVEFSWAGETARHVGTVVHRMLQIIATNGLDGWPVERVAAMQNTFQRMLTELGVPEPMLGSAVDKVCQTLVTALGDPRGRWILDSGHKDAVCEYAVSGIHQNRLVDSVIDRSFIDKDNVRWIIDYKTGEHEGSDLDAFVERELVRYTPQLARYVDILTKLDKRPVKAALYFPQFARFCIWEAERYQQS